MDKAYFLLTDVDVLDGSYQVLQRLSSPPLNTIVYAIVSDFETLRNLRGAFPHANFLYLDLKKSVNVNKEVLSCLPELDCILNYSDDLLANSLHRVRAIRVSKTACMDADSVSMRAIHEVLDSNEKIGTVVINVQKKERNGCSGAEALTKLIQKENHRRYQEELEGSDLRFYPGRRFTVPKHSPISSGTANYTQTNLHVSPPSPPPSPSPSILNRPSTSTSRFANLSPLLLQESAPLLHTAPTRNSARNIFSRMLSTLFCCIYPRCFILQEMPMAPPRFQHEQEIRSHIRRDQHLVLRRKLKRLLDSAEADWYRIMSRIDSDEVLQIEALSLRMKQISPLQMLKISDNESENSGSDFERLLAHEGQCDSRVGHWQISSSQYGSGGSGSGDGFKAREREIQMELDLAKELQRQEEEHGEASSSRGRRRRHPAHSDTDPTATTSAKHVSFVWDANREFHELADDIRSSMREERRCKEEEFYSLWVGRILTNLRGNKDKCLNKYEKLYFETFRRPAPFE